MRLAIIFILFASVALGQNSGVIILGNSNGTCDTLGYHPDMEIVVGNGTSPDTSYSNFTWNKSLSRLGIGIASPAAELHLHDASGIFADWRMTTSSTGTSSLDGFSLRQYAANTWLWNLEDGNMEFLTGGSGQFKYNAPVNIANATAPATPSNSVTLFAEDVSSSSELKVKDEAGNTTTLSPHNFSLIGDPSHEMAWSYYSERDGKAINVDMFRVVQLLEQLTGEKLIHIKDLK